MKLRYKSGYVLAASVVLLIGCAPCGRPLQIQEIEAVAPVGRNQTIYFLYLNNDRERVFSWDEANGVKAIPAFDGLDVMSLDYDDESGLLATVGKRGYSAGPGSRFLIWHPGTSSIEELQPTGYWPHNGYWGRGGTIIFNAAVGSLGGSPDRALYQWNQTTRNVSMIEWGPISVYTYVSPDRRFVCFPGRNGTVVRDLDGVVPDRIIDDVGIRTLLAGDKPVWIDPTTLALNMRDLRTLTDHALMPDVQRNWEHTPPWHANSFGSGLVVQRSVDGKRVYTAANEIVSAAADGTDRRVHLRLSDLPVGLKPAYNACPS